MKILTTCVAKTIRYSQRPPTSSRTAHCLTRRPRPGPEHTMPLRPTPLAWWRILCAACTASRLCSCTACTREGWSLPCLTHNLPSLRRRPSAARAGVGCVASGCSAHSNPAQGSSGGCRRCGMGGAW